MKRDKMDIFALLSLSVEKNASDLHLTSGMVPWVRINGDLTPLEDIACLTAEKIKQALDAVLDETQQKKLQDRLEIDFAISVPNLARFRVNIFYKLNGLAAVFRIIPKKIRTLDELGLPVILKKIAHFKNGLVLVTGPTGSGKSTTLAALIDYINVTLQSHVITIEDPIEFIHQSKKSLFNQREVYRDTPSFNQALTSALRQDPDIILIGELRDLKTIRLALRAAETGHLVLATLHTSTAPRTINRIVEVFPTSEQNRIRLMLSESLQAIVCQTLLKCVRDERLPILEILLATTAVRNLIRENKIAQLYSVMQTGKDSGMCTFFQYLQEMVRKQLITEDQFKANAHLLSL